MSRRGLEKRGLSRWTLVAVPAAAAVAIMMVVGTIAVSAQPADPPGPIAPMRCVPTPNEVYTYVILGDDQGIPRWVVPTKDFHARKGDGVLFVNLSGVDVKITAVAPAHAFTVFDEGDEFVVRTGEHSCRILTKGVKPNNRVELNAGYYLPTPSPMPAVATSMTTSVAGAAGRPVPTKTPTPTATPTGGAFKPLAGPGMEVDN